MFKRRYTQNIINLIVMFVCICTIFAGTSIINNLKETKDCIKSNIEKEWRQQAKRTLSNIQDKFVYDMNNGLVDPASELSLQQWAKTNISGVLNGGETGDMFMINLGDEKFIWDGSPDCAKPEFITNGRYLSDEAEMHYDQKQAELIIDKMRLGQSTLNTSDNYWWNFDGSSEYLEWTIIPSGSLGFGEEPITIGGIKNEKYSKVLIALGTQKDEIESTFTKDFQTIDKITAYTQIFVSLCIGVCIFNMIIYVYFNKRKQ